jgi:hypothetical protein
MEFELRTSYLLGRCYYHLSHSASPFLYWIFLRWSFVNYFPWLALPDLCHLSSWDYRSEPPMPGFILLFFETWFHWPGTQNPLTFYLGLQTCTPKYIKKLILSRYFIYTHLSCLSLYIPFPLGVNLCKPETFFLLVVLEFEPRVSHLLGRYSLEPWNIVDGNYIPQRAWKTLWCTCLTIPSRR